MQARMQRLWGEMLSMADHRLNKQRLYVTGESAVEEEIAGALLSALNVLLCRPPA